MSNLDDYSDEIKKISSNIAKASESELLEYRYSVIEILSDFLGIKWTSEREPVIKDESPVDDQMVDYDLYREQVEIIGSKDGSTLLREEIENDLNDMIQIFYELQKDVVSGDYEEVVENEDVINEDEEEIV